MVSGWLQVCSVRSGCLCIHQSVTLRYAHRGKLSINWNNGTMFAPTKCLGDETLSNMTVTIFPSVLQELLLRLVQDYYPLPANPSQEPPTAPTTTPSHLRTPASKRDDSDALLNRKSGSSAEQANKKRKRGKAIKEAGPKSRRTKKSVKASKGVQEDVVKAEVKAESFDGESFAWHMHVFSSDDWAVHATAWDEDPCLA